jgi:hypothetical protein
MGTVAKGAPLSGNIGATEWNAVRQLVQREALKRPGFLAGPEDPGEATDGIVLVANQTSRGFNVGEVVGLDSPQILTLPTVVDLRANLYFSAVAPTEDHTGKFGVLLDGLGPNGVAPAQIFGICAAKLNMQAATDAFADVDTEAEESASPILKSGASGGAQILYHFPQGDYPQETVGYVRVGNKSSGATQIMVAYTDDYIISGSGVGSNPGNPKTTYFEGIYEDAPSFAEYVDSGDGWVRITKAGKYLVVVTATIEAPPSTGDAQEINIGMGKRAGIGGSDICCYASMNVVLYRTGFLSSMSDQRWGYPTVAQFEEDDHLFLRSYHASPGDGTKINLTIAEVRLVIMPYNQ